MKNGKDIKKKMFNKMHDNIMKDLEGFSNKWSKNVPAEFKQWPFFLQMRDAYHNVLSAGACTNVLNTMIKDAKKDALKYHRDLLKEK
tara:strand:+ start:264 stop:524 length:261 start_codon:yes stop_codon:yes gene_type:complete